MVGDGWRGRGNGGGQRGVSRGGEEEDWRDTVSWTSIGKERKKLMDGGRKGAKGGMETMWKRRCERYPNLQSVVP